MNERTRVLRQPMSQTPQEQLTNKLRNKDAVIVIIGMGLAEPDWPTPHAVADQDTVSMTLLKTQPRRGFLEN